MQNNLVKVVEQQNVIISIQSGVINELFQLLSQHIAAEELDSPSGYRQNQQSRRNPGGN